MHFAKQSATSVISSCRNHPSSFIPSEITCLPLSVSSVWLRYIDLNTFLLLIEFYLIRLKVVISYVLNDIFKSLSFCKIFHIACNSNCKWKFLHFHLIKALKAVQY